MCANSKPTYIYKRIYKRANIPTRGARVELDYGKKKDQGKLAIMGVDIGLGLSETSWQAEVKDRDIPEFSKKSEITTRATAYKSSQGSDDPSGNRIFTFPRGIECQRQCP
jgi:hypothetical protein